MIQEVLIHMAITKDMTIMNVIGNDENIADILMQSGMHCLGCPSSRGETVEEACMVHGLVGEQMDKLLALVNEEANRDFDDAEAAE